MNKIKGLSPHDLHCNVFSAYDYNALSMQELLCEFFSKINDCVDLSNDTFKLAEWLVSEGLSIEVAKKLDVWLTDGTLDDIINVSIFNDLNEKINTYIDNIVDITLFGCKGDNETDNTTILNDVINNLKDGQKLFIPKGKFLFKTLTINKQIDIQLDGELISTDLEPTNTPLTLKGDNSIISGKGSLSSNIRKIFILDVSCNNTIIRDITIKHTTKSNMAPTETGIYYGRGGIAIKGESCMCENIEVFNIEGSGIYGYKTNGIIKNCYIHDNCTGILLEPGTKHWLIDGNKIINNDVNNVEGYDGILATTDFLSVVNNIISYSGEHGTYIHGTNITISNNIVTHNWFNGIKVGNVKGCVISNNVVDENVVSGWDSESEIYVQRYFDGVVVNANTSYTRNNKRWFLRVYSDKTEGSCINITISNNITPNNMWVNAQANVLIENNTCLNLQLGALDSTYPITTNLIVKGNVIKETLTTSNHNKALIEGNRMQNVSRSSMCSFMILKNNILVNQTSQLTVNELNEIVGNDITFNGTGEMIKQGGSKYNGLIKIVDNKFKLNNKLIYFSSAGVSTDKMIITGNYFEGTTSSYIDIYGNNHIISNNIADKSLGYIGVNNSIITNNINPPTFRGGTTGNQIANNI